MSTFKGVIDEFPDIQVDQFRPRPDGRLPLRCFLSHIHSDHLDGLLTFKSPFIHCSPATKELLIRLERKKQRSMFVNGITEAREQQYKHLKDILKPIPLETPTKIELMPGYEIQVTLFDANHCPGAVMFLFEGYGKAVLYTGDIRSEPWFINKLTRSPFMIEYSTGLKTLDCIYLDTSNTRSIPFPTKAEGLRELLQKMSKYPKDTIFHFSSWTFGYEEVWMALSKALNSPIHIEAYRYRLYESLCGNGQTIDDKPNRPASGKSTKFNLPAMASEGSTLIGYNCGNTFMSGCLTKDPTARLHTCEKGTCPIINSMENTVWIRPIVTRTKDGSELAEVGIDRGDEDLNQNLVFNIEEQDFKSALRMLDITDDLHSMEVKRILVAGWRIESKRLVLSSKGLNIEEGPLSLVEIVTALLQSLKERRIRRNTLSVESQGSVLELPTVITFPYSRHSSYAELCDLVRVFKPRDVYPCTVNEQHWDEANLSIQNLFGRLCSSKAFRHEREMDVWYANRVEGPITQQTQMTTTSQSSQLAPPTPEQRRRVPVDHQPQIAFRRNSLSRLRTFDQEGNELVLTVQSRGSPPPQLFASPPNAESQGLRRKAIREELDGVGVKRVRLSDENSRNSPIVIEDDMNEAALRRGQEENSEPSFAGDVGNDVPSRGTHDLRNIEITTQMETNWQVASMDEYYDSDNYAGLTRLFDRVDGVWRCTNCDHEIWGGRRGFCTGIGCNDEEGELPYMEVLDPDASPLPDISHARHEDFLFEGDELKLVVGPCLDYDSSAYDSFDSDSEFQEEYDEADSFIDDSEDQVGRDLLSGDDDADDDLTHQNGPNYEALYNQLRTQHSALITNFSELDDDYRSLKREIGRYSSDDADDEDDEMDEDGLHIVDVKALDPITTEIMITHALEQSQEEIYDDRIQARVQAYEAAKASSWDDIEMMSTTANHTLPEIEL